MRKYQIKTNLVSIRYKIGDIITENDLSGSNIAYHLSKGNIVEMKKATKEKLQELEDAIVDFLDNDNPN